ncbi:MAG: 2Fe-2S iron-sulfur cluster binding domain-containing protein, partial [Melioribacteraceae bacterium]|nr:2Fe-2S iron-sulfur cluster binding domain-containing protein [Melioribacteraceae bacterium]
MDGINIIIIGVVMFTLIVLVLVGLILVAKSKLVASGNVTISINDDDDKSLTVPIGGKLLNVLSDNKIYLPSACGGGGTCGECKCIVPDG